LLTVLEQETGHALLASAEETKIALTSAVSYQAPFEFIEPGFFIDVRRQLFEESIRVEIEKIAQAATQCIQDAGVSTAAIELVILTGGSTEVPRVQEEFRRLFPNAALADENKLSSVGLGLAYDSRNKFG